MTRQRHYHPLAALRFLRKAVVVCLLPLANALLEFSLNALLTALRQDAALLLFLCGASSILLEASSWALDEAGVLRLRWAFLSKRERIIRGEALAALTIERPLFFRLLGASRVVLYPVGQPAKRAVTLYLHKEDAQELADRLMPVRDPVCHRPAGGERAALVVLGANGLSTLALTYLAIRQSRPFPLTAEAVALSRLNVLVRFAAHWLPAGAAWMLVLAGSLFGISLARSFVQTVHYTVWHTADQLGSRGGWLSRFEFRVRSSEISYADVRVAYLTAPHPELEPGQPAAPAAQLVGSVPDRIMDGLDKTAGQTDAEERPGQHQHPRRTGGQPVGREPDEDVQPGEGHRLGGEGKWSALPDGQIGQRQCGQTVGTQNHQCGPLAPGRAVADRVPDRHQAVGKLLRVFFVQIKGDGSLGRLAHRVEHHPAGPEQPKEERPFDGQRGQSFAPDDAFPLGEERPPQPEHTGLIQRPAAGFQQDGAGPAEEEQKRGVLPQSCEQSVQAELQQGVRQRQQADDDRLAQEAEGGEGMVMPLSGHGASSARM